MKRILLTIFLFAAVAAHGQSDTGRLVPGSLYLDDAGSNRLIITETYDTIPCIMLVCDTAHSLFSNAVWWEHGFIIRRNPGYFSIWVNVTPSGSDSYMDRKKQPLPKTYIVWMSINIKE